MRTTITSVLMLLFALSMHAQGLRSIYDQSMKALGEKDYETFKALNLQALDIHPSQTTFLYNTSLSYAMLNQKDSALYYMGKLISWNVEANIRNEDFMDVEGGTQLIDSSKALNERFRKYRSIGEEVFQFTTLNHVEDITGNAAYFYATDVYGKHVFRFRPKDEVPHILRSFGLSPVAITMSSKGRDVWVSTARILDKALYPVNLGPELIGINSKNGEIKKRIQLPDSSIVGSMAMLNRDILLATNSHRPEIFVVDLKEGKVKTVVPIQEGFSLQGITVDPDHERVYLSDYIRGICYMDSGNLGKRNWLVSKDFMFKGIDGLVYIGKSRIIGFQNNSTPKRVVRIDITGDAVEKVEILENDLDYRGEPTNGYYRQNKGLYYVANSAWPFYDDRMNPKEEVWEDQKIRFMPEQVIK